MKWPTVALQGKGISGFEGRVGAGKEGRRGGGEGRRGGGEVVISLGLWVTRLVAKMHKAHQKGFPQLLLEGNTI